MKMLIELEQILTHNHLSNVPGMAVFKAKPNPIGVAHTYGVKNYVTAKQIATNMLQSLDLLIKILTCIIGPGN